MVPVAQSTGITARYRPPFLLQFLDPLGHILLGYLLVTTFSFDVVRYMRQHRLLTPRSLGQRRYRSISALAKTTSFIPTCWTLSNDLKW